jgi:hypothetical protein
MSQRSCRLTGSTPTLGSSSKRTLGRAQQGAGQPEFLFHAPGELAGQPRGEGTQPREGQEPVEGLVPLAGDHAAQGGIEAQVFHHRQVFVEPKALGHVADEGGEVPGIALGIPSQDADPSRGGRHQARHQAHQGSLARPIGAHEPRQAAGVDLGGQPLEGLGRAKVLGNRCQQHRGRRGLRCHVHGPAGVAGAAT